MSSSDDSAVVDVPVICGPTGAGKSSVAMILAESAPTVIVSADSRQVYRRFDIGTAKPSAPARARVPHVGIDVADPETRFSAAEWAAVADDAIVAALSDGHVPLVVGGTGLYLRAIFDGLFEAPPIDTRSRSALMSELAAMDVATLRRWTARLDPPRAHLGRTQLLRAIEVALLTGERISDLHTARVRVSRWRPHYLVVDPGDALSDWNIRRTETMLTSGWLDEVRALMDSVAPDAPAWSATGYRAIREHLSGATSLESATNAIVIETRQYVKRQRTWFRHQLPAGSVLRVDPATDWRATVEPWWNRFASESR